ncbi:MAG: hypothetical protein QM811_07810 [Pirellulales bacterium]
MAESLDYVATTLEKTVGGDPAKLNAGVQALLQQIVNDHSAVVFNGNGYSEEWHKEAEKRGLPNLRNTVAALPVLLKKEYIDLFEKYKVLTERETRSRYEIYTERYVKDINTEAQCALSIAKTQILPAAYRYQGELAKIAADLKVIGKNPHLGTLETLTGMVAKLEEAVGELDKAANHKGAHDVTAEAKHFNDTVKPAMLAVREIADELETIVADDIWPLPKYQEMLFIK